MLNLPNFGIDATEAQIAAANRNGMRQMQIKSAQQQVHAQQMRMAGATGHGVNMGMGMSAVGSGNMNLGGGINPSSGGGGGGGIAVGGMGLGDMLPSGSNPRMMSQQQSHTRGVEAANAMSPQNMNVNVNQVVGPSGMTMGTGMQVPGMGGGMGNMGGMGGVIQGTAGGMGGPSQGVASNQQQSSFQQLNAILRNPNHPLMKYVLQTVPGFENMPINVQLQKLIGARVCLLSLLFSEPIIHLIF